MHLGASPDAGKAYSENRTSEIWDSFSRLISRCEEEQIDLLLIAGDLFHRQPLHRELKEVNYLFSKLTKTKVVFIAGNHDYIKPSSYYHTFQWHDNVFPLLKEQMGWVEFPELETCVYGFSYHQREIIESRYDQAYAPRRQQYEILLAHGGDEKHIPIKRQRLENLGYDYIALGHIHKPQELGSRRIRYAGALEPIDKNDVGLHGYVIGEISGAGVCSEFIAAAGREYVHMAISAAETMTGYELRQRIDQAVIRRGVQNMYKIILRGFRDPEVIFDLASMDPYGNILEIVDETQPAYDFAKLEQLNADNLLGRFISSLKNAEVGSLEAMALYEGVQAILKAKRG